MAYLNICGFETGDLSEIHSVSGTGAYSIQSTIKRTGSYAARVNPASTAYIGLQFGGLASTGAATTLGALATTYLTVYFRIESNPATLREIIHFANLSGGSNRVCEVHLTTTGTLKIQGATASSETAALSTGVWYRLDIKAVQSGTCELAVDGGTPVTCTGRANTTNYVLIGLPGGGDTTADLLFDDIAISNTAYPGAGQVNILKPVGTFATGSFTASGAATQHEAVDEVPHDSDTTYIVATANGNNLIEMEDAATGGVSGAIGAVKAMMIARFGAASNTATLYIHSPNYQGTSAITLTGSYATYALIKDSDSSGTSWTSSTVDAIRLSAEKRTTTDAMRCTALYAMVWCAGATAYMQSVSGTFGALYGGVAKRAGKVLSGISGSVSGTLIRVTNKSISGISGTLSGSLVADFISGGIEYLQNVSGAIGTITGSLAKSISKSVSGVISSLTSELSRIINKVLSGAPSSLSASLTRVTMKSFSGVAGVLSGALSTGKTTGLALEGAISAISGTLVVGVAYVKALAGELSSILGDVSRITLKGLSGSSGAVLGALSSTKVTLQALVGEMGALTGSVVRSVSKSLSGTITGSGVLATASVFLRALSGSLSSFTGEFSFKSIIKRAKMKGGSVVRSVISGGSRKLR